MKISKLDKDMNIDCLTDEIIISSDCILKMLDFKLGTQAFFDSVHTITVEVDTKSSMVDVQNGLDLINKYFIHLKNLKIKDQYYALPLMEAITIMKSNKINHISLGSGR